MSSECGGEKAAEVLSHVAGDIWEAGDLLAGFHSLLAKQCGVDARPRLNTAGPTGRGIQLVKDSKREFLFIGHVLISCLSAH